MRAIQQRAGGAFVRGVVLDQAVGLVERHGPESVIGATRRVGPVPPNQIKGLLADLAIEVAAGPEPAPDPAPPPDPVAQQERRRSIEQLVATYEAEGAEIPQDLRTELQACQNGNTPGGTHQ